MKVITWNVHGSKGTSPVWDVLRDLRPDIALLQEVGSIPTQVGDDFAILSRPATRKSGKAQRFHTAVLVKGEILGEIALTSRQSWITSELEFFKGNVVGCRVQPEGQPPVTAVSVYSPAWPVSRERLKDIDVSQVKTAMNPDVWLTDILCSALGNSGRGEESWVVGGDCNSSETFDADWQDKNKRTFGIRSSGNAEMLARMSRLGFTECLRKISGDNIIPTFKHSRGLIAHQLDHLFVSSDLSSRLGGCVVGNPEIIFGKGLSDHLPIIAEFGR